MEEEEEELKEGERPKFPLDKYERDEAIFPDSVILLQQEDKFLIDRVKNLSEEEIAGTHYTLKDMKRRLKKYRTLNESTVAEPSLADFFQQHSVPVFTRDAAETEEQVWEATKIFIERVSRDYYYFYLNFKRDMITKYWFRGHRAADETHIDTWNDRTPPSLITCLNLV